LDPVAYVNELCDRVDAAEPEVRALLPEADRRGRLVSDATALRQRFPDPATRPPLYGIPVGVKDIYRVDGFETGCGSALPAAFCGIVGFKPSYGRIPIAGAIPYSLSVDHVGLFTQDVAGMQLAASVLCDFWKPADAGSALPVLGVPDGPYLQQASPEGLRA